MSQEQSNIIDYLVCVIGPFAQQFSLTNAKAYKYLRCFYANNKRLLIKMSLEQTYLRIV